MENAYAIVLSLAALTGYIAYLVLRKDRVHRDSHMDEAWVMRHRKATLESQIKPPAWVNREGS